ncbi:MAG: hypothetical protein MUP63_00820 [Candidatus Nanohaloarchaeota archaeon QJJ-7]|nr:hypothetical protein [Candidatus Nanohaloarchaeota archaeon QJJ-7]
MEEADYDEVVEGTVDDVKDRVEAEDLDIGKVLEAEKNNKDRVTLIDWLEESAEEQAGGEGGEENVSVSMRTETLGVFALGLVIGLLVAGMLVSSGAGLPGTSSAPSADKIETYFSENSDSMFPQNVTVEVEEVEKMSGSNLYQADLVISAGGRNQTAPLTVTSDGRYIFSTPPIDTSKPFSEQNSAGAQ